ncbi:MAG: M14 family zinc carboxypeptidase [candidate division WOR-3 bacterium]|nr:M14 family zinc carboxypeptidase [candidate division WOR-3 bacterium]MDW7987738.1 M14 family zinc carboxypeptidase [candidate division WOR-3 bacterium]
MRKIFFALFTVLVLLVNFGYGKTMIVRVFVSDYEELIQRVDFKYTNIEIVGVSPREWYELLVPEEDYFKILSSGLRHVITIDDLEAQKEALRGQYRSLDSVNLFLRNLAQNFSNICVLDSLGRSYENRMMYGIKISDNPTLDEENIEPGVFICGLHHSREWATIEVCLFFADSILRAYNSNPNIQNLINNHQIWIFPVINPDGYVYDYPQQRSWRKNRQPFSGAIGTDINRNYLGACDTNRYGFWGALASGAQSSHYPSSETFMGAFGASSPEIKNVTNFFRQHNINVSLSFHSYSELVLWPWGFLNIPTPDNALYTRVGNTMASLINKLNGGTYTPGQIPSLYIVSSGSDDWIYGYNKFVKGNPCLAYTIEVGTQFYQPTSQLDQICRENFKAIYYLTTFSDSVRVLVKPYVAPPELVVPETVSSNTFVIHWQPKNANYNQPTQWEVEELREYNVFTDDFESMNNAWITRGFVLSTRRAYSGTKSMYSDSANNISNYIRTRYPYYVRPGDSLTFWCWYNLERNYDVAVVEVSYDTREWFQLGPRLTDTATSWRRLAYSLDEYVGKSIYIQFRVMTDGSVLRNGFYIDDVYPVPFFNSSHIVSSTVADTFLAITVNAPGVYWYRVKGYNTANGWGEYSTVKPVTIIGSTITENSPTINNLIQLKVTPNIFINELAIEYYLSEMLDIKLSVYNSAGQEVLKLRAGKYLPGQYQILWNKSTLTDFKLSPGIYFIKLETKEKSITKRVVVL